MTYDQPHTLIRPDVADGQNRKSARLRGMSVLPPRADIARPSRHVRFVPIADIARLVWNERGANWGGLFGGHEAL